MAINLQLTEQELEFDETVNKLVHPFTMCISGEILLKTLN